MLQRTALSDVELPGLKLTAVEGPAEHTGCHLDVAIAACGGYLGLHLTGIRTSRRCAAAQAVQNVQGQGPDGIGIAGKTPRLATATLRRMREGSTQDPSRVAAPLRITIRPAGDSSGQSFEPRYVHPNHSKGMSRDPLKTEHTNATEFR